MDWGVLQGIWDPLNLEDRFCVVYLLSALLIVITRQPRCAQMLISWLSSGAVQQALWLDLITFLVQKGLLWALVSPWFLVAPVTMCAQWAGVHEPVELSLALALVLALLHFVLMDLGFFVAHVLQHRIPALWVFHAVHHSAERLNPFTAFRVHLVDDVLSLSVVALLTGLVSIVEMFVLQGVPRSPILENINPFLGVFYTAGFILRHSEVPLSFGSFWSTHFISPVQHQWHHSRKDADRDINFGFCFAWWDRLHRSFRMPAAVSPSEVGVHGLAYTNVLDLTFKPCLQLLGEDRGLLWASVLATLIMGVGWESLEIRAELRRVNSVHLEALRREDLEVGLSQGKTTLIIPTGGIEQNGVALSLGKHNIVIHEAADRLAKRLGQTYVAPVVPYVPNGAIDPPSGHMQFVGSFSITEAAYRAYLLDIARSAIHQGFKTLLFMHAHGLSAESEHRVADEINTTLPIAGVRAIVLDAYYDETELRQELDRWGLTEPWVGHHAGLIDTSELEAIDPESIWIRSLGLSDPGQDGFSFLASPALGDWILNQRINAAQAEFYSKSP